jgi:hypothetical protein
MSISSHRAAGKMVLLAGVGMIVAAALLLGARPQPEAPTPSVETKIALGNLDHAYTLDCIPSNDESTDER